MPRNPSIARSRRRKGTNPIESTFATVRHRTGKTKGCLSRKTGLAMAFKLMMSAQTKWRKLDGTITKVHRHGQGAKGGLKVRLSDALAAA